MKKQFLYKEFWLLTVGAAFQRANIYKNDSGIDNQLKSAFKDELYCFLQTLINEQYHSEVNEEQHIINIWSLSNFSGMDFDDILINGKLNFGVSQKLLNLYLKYLWCKGDVVTPPHFPVDRIIQQKLKVSKLNAWTKIKDEKTYLEIISHARNVLKTSKYNSLAELELNIYQRK